MSEWCPSNHNVTDRAPRDWNGVSWFVDDVDERGAPSTYATVAGMDFYRITRTYPDKMGERWVILLVQSGNYMRREARKDGKRPSVRTFRTPQAAAAALVGRPS